MGTEGHLGCTPADTISCAKDKYMAADLSCDNCPYRHVQDENNKTKCVQCPDYHYVSDELKCVRKIECDSSTKYVTKSADCENCDAQKISDQAL